MVTAMWIFATLSLIGSFKECAAFRMTTRQRTSLTTINMNSAAAAMAKEHVAYLTDVARVKPPTRLQAMLEIIELQDLETLISPTDRKGLNPFLIPLTRNKRDGSRLCYIRWPTQKDDMELQLCRTTDVGVVLVALGTDQYAHRLACEMDFYCTPTGWSSDKHSYPKHHNPHSLASTTLFIVHTQVSHSSYTPITLNPPTPHTTPSTTLLLPNRITYHSLFTAPKAVEILNRDGQLYTTGAYLDFLKSGKFPSLTDEDLKLVLDRYLLTKVGAFPDCYESLANNFIAAKNEVSALVTCERAVSIFYGWGHPVAFHARALSGMADRMVEARDAARSALGDKAHPSRIY